MPLPASRAGPAPAKRVDFKPLEFQQCCAAVGDTRGSRAVDATVEPRPWSAVKPPEATDWLCQFKEEGQTFAQFKEQSSASTDSLLHGQNKGRNTIYLLPDPDLPAGAIDPLRLLLEAYFYPLKVQPLAVVPVAEWKSVPSKVYQYSAKPHINTEDVLNCKSVQDHLKSSQNLVALVLVTAQDLYSVENKEERVELGRSFPTARFACVSVARLHPSFFSKPALCISKAAQRTNMSLMLARAFKLVSHHILSVLLLQRCIYFGCNMNGAFWQELDARSLFLCPVDLQKLLLLLGAAHSAPISVDDLALKRYENMRTQIGAHLQRNHVDWTWLDKRIKLLSTPAPAAAGDSSQPRKNTLLHTNLDEETKGTDLTKWVIGKTGRIDEFYTMGQPIGTPGQFGQAFLVKHTSTGETRVVKVVSKQKFHSDKSRAEHFEQLRNEIGIMKKAKHPNIIHFYEVFESAANLYIVMECCSGGELFDRIQQKGTYSERDASGVLRQIIEGIKYLHEQRIAHCDLKPDNFLFLTKDADAKLKIIDFGMSKHLSKGTFLAKFRGTPYYVAPEVLSGKYSEHCDIWSFGVVMFVCLFGFPPFHANSNNEIFDKIEAGFTNVTKTGYGPWFPAAIPCSADAKDLIAKCLTINIAARPTATEVLEHKWFNGGASTDKMLDVVVKNLNNFVSSNQFKMEVLALMVDVMGRDELKGLAQMFADIDANGDGLISPDELIIAFKKQGVEDEKVLGKVTELMKSADADGDGSLSYNELLLASVQKKLAAKEERLWQAFCKFDKDLDGSITAAEIAQVLSVSVKEAEALVKEVDVNGDGEVDYDEFSKMMMEKEEAEFRDVKVQKGPKPAAA